MTTSRRRSQISWFLGLLLIWFLGWALLGLRYLLVMGSTPHPFVPQLKYTGVMLHAVAGWALAGLAAHLILGTLAGFLAFLALRVGQAGDLDRHLGFRKGLSLGAGTFLWIHGILYLEVPGALGLVNGLQWLPMGLSLLLLLGGGAWWTARGLGLGRTRTDLFRLLGAGVAMILLLHLPHDLFRKLMPRSAPISPDRPRLLVLGIDGLRQDVTEKARPDWKAPGGAQPIVVVPATRLAWNILLGADPQTFSNHLVIPFASEWEKPPQTFLLDKARQQGISTGFIIDDSTTLSFGLSRTPFDEVVEPDGGWKHFFTVGAGGCWPAYSWAENYVSPVETTNPWSDPEAFFRDVEHLLDRREWVSGHTCQLHAPFFLRFREIQSLRPWTWLFHTARSYQSYQALEQAERDQYRRAGGRANPVNHYRIRTTQLLNQLAPHLARWEKRYPHLSGVLTSDHGEAHLPVVTPDGTLVSFLTGVHGFDLDPNTVRVPLHPFGLTHATLTAKDVYSWLDLRADLGRWLNGRNPLALTSNGAPGWLVSFRTIQATHAQPKEIREHGGLEGAGTRPVDLVRRTYLNANGIWAMDDPDPEELKKEKQSYALVTPDRMVTLNPVGPQRVLRQVFSGYDLVESQEIDETEAVKEVQTFRGMRSGTPLSSQ